MHIYVSLALFACLLKGFESSFYAYLRESRPLWHAFGRLVEQFLCILTWVSTSLACLWTGLESSFYAYLRESRPLCMSFERLRKEILCIFTWISPSLACLWKVWWAALMHIYVGLALFACLWAGLENSFYAYLRESHPLCMPLERLGKQILCIFTWVSPSLACLWKVWWAVFMHIYMSLALFACLLKGLESRFYIHIYVSLALFG